MPNNQEEMIPVYLFLGFLEAGKTKFIQEAMEDKRFSTGEPTLLLICEEGIEEYDIAKIPQDNIYVHVVEEESELTEAYLQGLIDKYNVVRVMIEYNGMWQINTLFENMPENWGVYQAVMIADATTFMQYNANMRGLVVDKLNLCELVYFNRFTREMQPQEFHQIVRGVSRRADIYYEFTDGETIFDDIEDPLPFDTEADHIVIEDRDFALWYRDLMETPAKYNGKTMTFKALAVRNPTFPKNVFAVGRHIMTCCVDDIQYCWIGAQYEKKFALRKGQWVTVTGTLRMQPQGIRRQAAPMLHVTSLADAEPPEQEVATFF